jgi:hypothetical protein
MSRSGIFVDSRGVLISLLPLLVIGCFTINETAGTIGETVRSRIRTQTMPVDIVLARDISLDLGFLKPGQPMPPQLVGQEFPFSENWPSIEDIKAELSAVLGESLSSLVQITSVRLESVELMASAGSFGAIKAIELTVILPNSSTVAFHGQRFSDPSQLVFIPQNGPDLIALMQQYGGKKTTVHLRVSAEGNVPNPEPLFDVVLRTLVTFEF